MSNLKDLADGETTEMKGSGKKPYTIKNTGGVYSCSCPAWRNQSLSIEKRTCKHIRKLRGDDAEQSRIGKAIAEMRNIIKVKVNAPDLLLAHSWDGEEDVTGYWMSEKLDGVRAYWDGKRFISRLGNIYHAPDWFIKGMPDIALDGELWVGRGLFQTTVSIVRRQDKNDEWKKVKYIVFDAPGLFNEIFEKRMAFLENYFKENIPEGSYIRLIEQKKCNHNQHLLNKLAKIEREGGEGVMLRKPGSLYEGGRSTTLLKVKTFHDAEAVVTAHIPGKGRHKGRLGALEVEMDDGTIFSVGSGFSDREREDPPAVGDTITYRYQELTKDGVPRFPTFVRVRDDA